MKKLLIVFLILGLTEYVYASDIVRIRTLFEQANLDEEKNNELINLTKPYSLSKNPLYYAYYAAGVMSLANHTYWPLQKLDYFNEGKEMLEKAIARDSRNVEIRFIRYSIQKNAPSFLGYSGNIEADRKFILDNLNTSTWSAAYKKKIKQNLSL
ncbi:hypothetical protein [Crocinitomix algicola]|uniref:hypothetical protein n=1 Tax=Crocinitomix algicola TaxID=1740263 RepID=UPI00087348B7|nr:hypothetical protein [Crocinitomix algicola]